jgi:two-component system nitrogen regulation sensor histidine kinase NtrY
MTKNSLLRLLAGAILAATAYTAHTGYKDTALLEACAARLEEYLSRQEQSALEWIERERLSLEWAAQGRLPEEPEVWSRSLSEQSKQPYTVLVHQRDSVLFASNNKVFPAAEYRRTRVDDGEWRGAVHMPAGCFYVYSRPWEADVRLSVWVPVELRISEQRFFPLELSIPSSVRVVPATEGVAVRMGGKALFGLSSTGRIQASWAQKVVLAAGLLLLVLLLAGVSQVALRLHRQNRSGQAALLLGAVLVGLIALNATTAFLSQQVLWNISVFARPLEHSMVGAHTVGDLFLHMCLLLWFSVFFHRISRVEGIAERLSVPVRMGLSALAYGVAIGSVLGLVWLYRRLVFDSGIFFDFDNLFNLDRFSSLALAGLLAVLLALFLWHHRLIFTTHQCRLSRGQYAVALGIGAAVALTWGAIKAEEIGLLPLALVGLSVVYVALFQRAIAKRFQRLVGLALWLIAFSALTAGSLYAFYIAKDRQTRLAYAEALALGRDATHAEPLLRQAALLLAQDSVINYMLKPWPFRPLAADLRRRAYEHAFVFSYLFQNYRLSVFAFDKDGSVLPQDQVKDREEIVNNCWEKGIPITGATDIRYIVGDKGVFRYMVRTRMLRMNDPTQPAEVYYFFDHVYPQPTRVYSELFYRLPFKGMERLLSYDYAVQRRGQLVVDQGNAGRIIFSKNLPRGRAEERISTQPRRVDAVYSTADGTAAAAVGRSAGDVRKPIYLFSVLFALCLLIIVGVAFLNTWLVFLPAHYQLSFAGQGSLSKRIHYRTFALIGAGFAGVVALTYAYFAEQARKRERSDLDRRAEALLTYLRIEMSDTPPHVDTLAQRIPQLLAPQAASLTTDVNFFSPQGHLLFSTQQPLVHLGVLPARMSTDALVRLSADLEPEAMVSESVGKATYTNRYLPVRNNQHQLLGFLGVPYYLSERKLGPEVSDFIGLLASVYVFLMFIAYGVSYTLSNSIIGPLKLISNKIQRLKLEDKNEPLEYTASAGEEISALIEEYNRMVDKLEESKAKLIRLERESAWREMARQVAHDIKNPLTTIKLSMQQLERLSSNPEQAAAYLKKAIARLIEQIDSLAQIATEFSLFANLDIRHKQDIVLNDVVESVYDLFTEDRNVEMSIDLPEERLHIRGDKNHLIRVFNNLIINAIQAIPSERKGRIALSLTRQGEYSVVCIRDNGGGIPPEIQERVFEPNFTTKSSGSGLGLAICKRIIEAHDGNIYFETRLGEGTDFYVELPVSACETPADRPQEVVSG